MKKKIIQDNLSRKNIKDKLEAALAKKPTVSQLNSIKETFGEKQKLVQERLIRNGKNRKRFSNNNNRPQTIQISESIISDAPIHKAISYEVTTPPWFRSVKKADISIIIPIYKSKEVLVDLIKSWPLETELNVEVIFVEDNCPNSCKDVVVKAWNIRKSELKNTVGKIICNKNNVGYGLSCNVGAAVATGEYLIFLNADTELTKGWIQPMIDLFKDPKVGLLRNLQRKQGGRWHGTIDSAGSEWRWGDDSFVHVGRHSYKKRGIGEPMTLEAAPKDVLETAEREMVTGCCFAMKKELFDYIGGFNPNYRIGYWEDSEICMNVRELGYKVMFEPRSIIWHKLGHTSSGGHKFFSHNREYFRNKWVKSGRLHDLLIPKEERPRIESILVKRTSAHGDALVASGVCAALKKKYPEAKILFSTLFSEVVVNSPYIDDFVPIEHLNKVNPTVFYNLDLAYEWRPKVNILDAYAEYCGVKKEDCIVHLPRQEFKEELPDDFIIIHPGRTDWVGRDWPHENFVQLATNLLNQGEKIVCIGKHSESEIPCTVDVRGKTTIAQLAWIMNKAKLFIGIDSFPMHVAQVANIPSIAFFGCIDPALRIYNKKLVGITANNLKCLGCHHRKPAPSTVTKTCETGELECIKNVSVTQMMNLVNSMLTKDKNDIVSLLG